MSNLMSVRSRIRNDVILNLKSIRRYFQAKRQFSRLGARVLKGSPENNELIQKYWRQCYGRAIYPIWHNVIYAVTGKPDERYIPHDVWFNEVIPYFNNNDLRRAYMDKNLARTLIQPRREVPSLLKRMHGSYYSNEGVACSKRDADKLLTSYDGDVIIKRSATDNGQGVRLAVLSKGRFSLEGRSLSLEEVEMRYGKDFAIQPRFTQHSTMSIPHPSSLNTIRVVTLRWGGGLHVLLAFMRIGVGGKITDNAGTGGVCRGITEEGRLIPHAVDACGAVYAVHPSSGYRFGEDDHVPGYQKICEYALELHERVFHFNLISWDFAINEDGEAVFLEMNFRGASYIYQFACEKPIFGSFTDEILSEVGLKNHR